jgi:hypothetical protein
LYHYVAVVAYPTLHAKLKTKMIMKTRTESGKQKKTKKRTDIINIVKLYTKGVLLR